MFANLNSFVTLRRRSASLIDASAAAATLAVSRQPVRASLVEVTVASTVGGGSGTVAITGLSEGATTTELLTFTAAGVKQTGKLFSSISGMTTTGLADESPPPTVSARVCGRDGSSQSTEEELARDYPAAVDERSGWWRNDMHGGASQDDHAYVMLPYCEVFSPREGDVLTDGQGRRWLVVNAPPMGGALHPDFWRLTVKRYETEP